MAGLLNLLMVFPLTKTKKKLINEKKSRTSKNNIIIPNNRFNLSGYNQNVRRINNKLNNCICYIRPCDHYDFLVLNKMWLQSEVLNYRAWFL